VDIIEPLGHVMLIHLSVECHPDALLRVVAPADAPIALGDRPSFRLRRDRLHLFDGASGRRLGDCHA
jgi:hypothetical protein